MVLHPKYAHIVTDAVYIVFHKLDIRHYINVMYVEKNVCDRIIWIRLNNKVKTEDEINVRKDLVEMIYILVTNLNM